MKRARLLKYAGGALLIVIALDLVAAAATLAFGVRLIAK